MFKGQTCLERFDADVGNIYREVSFLVHCRLFHHRTRTAALYLLRFICISSFVNSWYKMYKFYIISRTQNYLNCLGVPRLIAYKCKYPIFCQSNHMQSHKRSYTDFLNWGYFEIYTRASVPTSGAVVCPRVTQLTGVSIPAPLDCANQTHYLIHT